MRLGGRLYSKSAVFRAYRTEILRLGLADLVFDGATGHIRGEIP